LRPNPLRLVSLLALSKRGNNRSHACYVDYGKRWSPIMASIFHRRTEPKQNTFWNSISFSSLGIRGIKLLNGVRAEGYRSTSFDIEFKDVRRPWHISPIWLCAWESKNRMLKKWSYSEISKISILPFYEVFLLFFKWTSTNKNFDKIASNLK